MWFRRKKCRKKKKKKKKIKMEKSKVGRKPVQDKKQAISVYVRPSQIKQAGGADALREKLNQYIDTITTLNIR